MRGHRGGEAACPRATAAAGDADAPAAAPPSGRSQARSSSSYSTLRRDDPRGTPSAPGQLRTGQPRLRNRQIRVTVQAGPRHPPPPRQAGAAGDRSRQAAPGTPRSASEPSARVRQRTPSTHPTAPQHIPSRVQQHIPAACRTGRGARSGPGTRLRAAPAPAGLLAPPFAAPGRTARKGRAARKPRPRRGAASPARPAPTGRPCRAVARPGTATAPPRTRLRPSREHPSPPRPCSSRAALPAGFPNRCKEPSTRYILAASAPWTVRPAPQQNACRARAGRSRRKP